MRAILYSRWSSHEQSGTTSAPRQLGITEAFAKRQGWEIVERIQDEGVSAWNGANISTGRLGALIAQLEAEGGADVVLVVEKLDRLSRQSPLQMLGWVQRACGTGLTIATADGLHLINTGRLDREAMALVPLIFEAFRGHGESQAKSERVSEAWQQKRDRRAPMTRQCPAWLTIAVGATGYKSPENQTATYELIPERVEIVRRIFDMTANGYGKATIAGQLNKEGVPTWGRGRGWHASYIQKIVRNVAVLGEYQPHTKPKGARRKPAGEPIPNYFPAVVSAEVFERVNSIRAVNMLAQQSPNRLVNLFTKLAYCARCGATMSLVNKGSDDLANGTSVPRRYLKCSSAHRSAGCTNRNTYPYSVVEKAVLDSLLHVAMDDQHFAIAADLAEAKATLAETNRQLSIAQREQEFAYNLLSADQDDELAARRYRDARDQVKRLTKQVKSLNALVAERQGAVSPELHIARVAEVRDMLDHPDEMRRYEARRRVKLALDDLIADVRFEGRKRRFTVALAGDVRFLSFDASGSCGIDVDWTELRPRPDEDYPEVVQSYLRRKRARGPHTPAQDASTS